MARKVAVPAESLRRVARDASLKAFDRQDAGEWSVANRIRDAAAQAYDAAGGKAGELVSVDAEAASIVTAFSEDSRTHGLSRMLRHQYYWDDVEVPEVGEVYTDVNHNPVYGDGQVEVLEVTDSIAEEVSFEQDGIVRTVAQANKGHPPNAPVVIGKYVNGSDKTYAFPATRLQ